MDDQLLLKFLCGLEWSGFAKDMGACPQCNRLETMGHAHDCAFSDAIAFLQEKCEKQASWETILRDAGPGQIIAAPAEPRIWGVWNKDMRGWLGNRMDEVVHSPFRQVMVAKLAYHQPSDSYEIREIGPDGLPVPENE